MMMPAPADSPNRVTRSGSPPNAAMLSCTQRSAASTSRRPRLESNRRRGAVEFGQVEESQSAEPIVHGDDDRFAAAGQRPAVVQRLARRAEDVGPAVHPDHHRLAVARRGVGGRPDVQGQAVLALRRSEVDRDSRVDRLRADRAVAGGVGDGGPGLRWLGRSPPQVADRRRGVRTPFHAVTRPSSTPRTGPFEVSTRVLSRAISRQITRRAAVDTA